MIRRFKYNDFLPLDTLLAEKQRKGLTTSLVIPALNEAGTVGGIVRAVRLDLMDRIGLVDEMVVMDGGSEDGTVALAAQNGAVVHSVEEVPGGRNLQNGKGTALWKSLLVTKGDIVACIDADITNFDVRFVYGLLAPLILYSDLSFIKAFYERPLEINDMIVDNHGGRVTEILVRPLLATFYPELAELVQPLAGEYALRRSLAENLPFFTGYGVEIGLIIDVLEREGLSGLAQVDMGVRRHRNRDVRELGKMAFGILQAVLTKMQQQGRISMSSPQATTMVSLGEGLSIQKTAIEEIELNSVGIFRRTEK